jgi:hypothetical protein
MQHLRAVARSVRSGREQHQEQGRAQRSALPTAGRHAVAHPRLRPEAERSARLGRAQRSVLPEVGRDVQMAAVAHRRLQPVVALQHLQPEAARHVLAAARLRPREASKASKVQRVEPAVPVLPALAWRPQVELTAAHPSRAAASRAAASRAGSAAPVVSAQPGPREPAAGVALPRGAAHAEAAPLAVRDAGVAAEVAPRDAEVAAAAEPQDAGAVAEEPRDGAVAAEAVQAGAAGVRPPAARVSAGVRPPAGLPSEALPSAVAWACRRDQALPWPVLPPSARSARATAEWRSALP